MKSKLLILSLLFAMKLIGQTNSFVTENYLRLNFTPKSGVTPGTDNTQWMDCDQIIARYNVTISGVTTTGTRCPSQNQLTASSGCPAIGDSYQGGLVAYLFQSGDPGYVAGECHGIITTSAILGYYVWYDGVCDWFETGATGTALGTGTSNTTEIYNDIGTCNATVYAGEACYNLSSGGYSDWFLPSRDEAKKIWDSRSLLGGNTLYPIWTSTETQIQGALAIPADGVAYETNQTSNLMVRPVRYF